MGACNYRTILSFLVPKHHGREIFLSRWSNTEYKTIRLLHTWSRSISFDLWYCKRNEQKKFRNEKSMKKHQSDYTLTKLHSEFHWVFPMRILYLLYLVLIFVMSLDVMKLFMGWVFSWVVLVHIFASSLMTLYENIHWWYIVILLNTTLWVIQKLLFYDAFHLYQRLRMETSSQLANTWIIKIFQTYSLKKFWKIHSTA